ncbi:MAG: EamA family transporter [Actinomycetota bacterium]
MALAIVYVVWGSTYLAIRVAVGSMPPLLTAGVRFVVAAGILAAALALRHGPGVLRLGPPELRSTAVVGALLLAGGNGGVMFAEQTVPSGLAALLIAAVPLWVVLLRARSGDPPGARTVVGVLVGLLGLAVLALPGSSTVAAPLGVLTLLGAGLCWSSGSFLSGRMAMPANPFVATVWQMLAGGLLLLAIGAVRGELTRVDVGAIRPEGWWALAYLVVFGSLVAFTAYVWLLHNARLSLVSTYAYVNPVVAVALGALILNEPVTLPILAGGAIVLLGVAVVVTTERPGARLVEETEPVA